MLRLVSAAAAEDGVSPLSEHVLLHLRYGGDHRARDLLLVSDGEVSGYGHLDQADPAEGPSGELVIHPAQRRQGLGLLLTRALVAEAGRSGCGCGRTATWRPRPGSRPRPASSGPGLCGRCGGRCSPSSTSRSSLPASPSGPS